MAWFAGAPSSSFAWYTHLQGAAALLVYHVTSLIAQKAFWEFSPVASSHFLSILSWLQLHTLHQFPVSMECALWHPAVTSCAAWPHGTAQSAGSWSHCGCRTSVLFPISTSGAGPSLAHLQLLPEHYHSCLCLATFLGCFSILIPFKQGTGNRHYPFSPCPTCCVG